MILNLLHRFRNDTRFRSQMVVLSGMYLGFAALYMCRATVVIIGPAILDDASLAISKTEWGAILGWGTAGTLVGKIINGVLADKYGGRRLFLFALSLCLTATAFFSTLSGVLYFAIAYFLALFAKSAAWPSMANLINQWYPINWRGGIWGILSSSSRLSSLFTTICLGSLLLVFSWRTTLAASVALTIVVLVFLFFTLKQSPKDIGSKALPSQDGDDQSSPHHLDGSTIKEALSSFAKNPRFWLICASVICLSGLMEFQSFIPIYLKDTFDLSVGAAAISSAAFPAGSLFSVLAGGFIFDKLTKKNRIFVLGSLMTLTTVCIISLIAVPYSELPSAYALWVSLFIIMVFGFAIAPCYYIPMSVFAIDFGGVHCGLLICIIDVAGYMAALAFDFSGGALADQPNGWVSLLFVMLSLAVLGTIGLVTFLTLDHRSQKPS